MTADRSHQGDLEFRARSFWRMCQEFARGRLPEEILRAVSEDSPDDRVAEAPRRHPRNRRGRFRAPFSGTYCSPAVGSCGGASHVAFSICVVEQVWMRVRGPHRTSNDGFGPEHNVVVGGRDRAAVFCQAVLQFSFNVLVDRRCRRHS